MSKLSKMQRFLPGLYQPTINTNLKGVLSAWAAEDDRIVEQVQNAKQQIYVKFAKLGYLDALGSNVGVFRPSAVGLSDDQFRALIPALSFYPKQVVPTIVAVLEAFFGAGNPRVAVREINPNEIVVQIPSSVPALRRTIKGSHHFHNYSGVINSVDNVLKTVNISLDGLTKNLAENEWEDAYFGQDIYSFKISANDPGQTVDVQFALSANLSGLSIGQRFCVVGVPGYPGAFVPDKTKAFTTTKQRGILGQSIVAGNIYPTLTMTDSSGIPDAPGKVVFSYGREGQEGPIDYFGRPNNTTLLLDPGYTFLKDHSIGEMVNVIVTPYQQPSIQGTDYSVYLVGVEAARTLAQDIVESVVAAGIVVRWIVVEPEC